MLVVLGIAVHNFVKFVIREDKCQVAHPLFVFYILIFLTLISDVIYSLLIVPIYVSYMPFVLYMGPTFKLLSGLEQIWMMIELSMHLTAEIESHSHGNVQRAREAQEKTQK